MRKLNDAARTALLEIGSDIRISGHRAQMEANSARMLDVASPASAIALAGDALKSTRDMIERLTGYCDTLESEIKEQEAADA